MYKFIGNVNGVQYDTVEKYNKAITEAMEKQQPIAASYHTEEVTEDNHKSSTEATQSKLHEFNDKIQRFKLDKLSGTDEDHEIINAFKAGHSIEKAEELAKEAKDALSEQDQNLFVRNIRSNITHLDVDLGCNDKVMAITETYINNKFAEVGRLQKQLAEAKEGLAKARKHRTILERAGEILTAEKEFYNHMIKPVDPETDQIKTQCKECKPQTEVDLGSESEFPHCSREHVKNLLEEIFGPF